MIDQKKLQQLHARLEAYVESDPRIPNATGGMVTKRDLRDLVECFIEKPAADVNAAPPVATTDVDAAVAVLMASFDVLSPGDHAVAVIVGELWRQGEEIARLRAEAKPEQAAREDQLEAIRCLCDDVTMMRKPLELVFGDICRVANGLPRKP